MMRKYILITVILFVLESSFAIGELTTDLTTHSHLLKIFNTNQKQLRAFDGHLREIKSANRTYGAYINQSVLSQDLKDATTSLSQTTSVSRGCNYTLQRVARNPSDPRNIKRLQYTAAKVEKTFFPQDEALKRNSGREYDRIKENRISAIRESSKSGMALATTRQATVQDTEKEIVKVAAKASKSDNLREDVISGNRYLEVISRQQNQIIELLSKQNEMIASFLMMSSGTGMTTAPLDPAQQKPSQFSKRVKERRKKSLYDLGNGMKGSDYLRKN